MKNLENEIWKGLEMLDREHINIVLLIKKVVLFQTFLTRLPETPVSVGDFVVGQHRLFDLGELFEIGFDVFQACGGRQTPNKNLFRSHYL